jgi:hypothetical protein
VTALARLKQLNAEIAPRSANEAAQGLVEVAPVGEDAAPSRPTGDRLLLLLQHQLQRQSDAFRCLHNLPTAHHRHPKEAVVDGDSQGRDPVEEAVDDGQRDEASDEADRQRPQNLERRPEFDASPPESPICGEPLFSSPPSARPSFFLKTRCCRASPPRVRSGESRLIKSLGMKSNSTTTGPSVTDADA